MIQDHFRSLDSYRNRVLRGWLIRLTDWLFGLLFILAAIAGAVWIVNQFVRYWPLSLFAVIGAAAIFRAADWLSEQQRSEQRIAQERLRLAIQSRPPRTASRLGMYPRVTASPTNPCGRSEARHFTA